MTQLMQPLTGVCHQTPASCIRHLRVAAIPVSQATEAVTSSAGKGHGRKRAQLLFKEGMKALPAAFKIRETPISFKCQSLLQGCDPIEDQPQLTGGQSPFSGGNFGSEGLCQWERASRSRQRRSQWRCCRTIVCTSR